MTSLGAARRTEFEANGRTYRSPGAPVVVVCVDGSAPAYHEAAVAAGVMPWVAQMPRLGTSWPAQCALPALTNPNNLSIATGRPPSVHGVCGNYFFDAEAGVEVQMTDPEQLRAPTLFAAAAEAGLEVSVVTAKDKLRRLLGAGLPENRCWSAEVSARPRPEVYSAELSMAALAEGLCLLRTSRPDLLYISLSDYVQHKHAPGTPAANAFYTELDRYAALMSDHGAVVVLTADHGMNAKPVLVFLDDILADRLGESVAAGVRTVLPITDPYVAHHGALGSFAVLHLDPGADAGPVLAALSDVPGVAEALPGAEAAVRWSMPADRVGEVVVLADADTALGRSPRHHDLSGLDRPLRSHGALGEIDVPFLVNRPLGEPPSTELGGQLHNYDAFWVATTLVADRLGPR